MSRLRRTGAVLALVAALGLVAAACSSTPRHHASGTTTSSSTSTSSTTAPVSSSSSSTSPSTSTSTTLPAQRCSTGVLAVAANGVSTSAGTTRMTFALKNQGPSPCSLEGYPNVALYGPSGAGGAGAGSKLALSDIDLGGAPKAMLLAPGYGTNFVISVAEVPVNGAGCQTVASLEVSPPGSSESLSLPDSFQACGTSIGVYPLSATPPPG